MKQPITTIQVKAKELKIGNLLIYDNQIVIVESIFSSTHKLFVRSLDGEVLTEVKITQCSPIQLSEEWLLTKCEGFKKDDVGNIWRETNDGYISLREMDGYWNCTIVFFWDNTDEPEHRYLLPKMNFIHQLQNAWAVITSEELKIKQH